jgi:uncharacterized protein YjbI with pentapeptide repeats
VDDVGDDVRPLLKQGKYKSCAKCDLAKTDLSGANLTGAILNGANLTDADLTGADLTGAKMRFAKLDGVIGADFSDAFHVPAKYLKD